MEGRLFRSRKNRVLFGVCGGIGDYFHTDPVIIRVIAVLLIIPGIFPAVIAYLILTLIIPLEGTTSNNPHDSFKENLSDMQNTTAGLGNEIRTLLENKDSKTVPTKEPPAVTQPQSQSNRALLILGLIVIVLGIFFLLITIFNIWRFLWPLLLIITGLIVILLVTRKR